MELINKLLTNKTIDHGWNCLFNKPGQNRMNLRQGGHTQRERHRLINRKKGRALRINTLNRYGYPYVDFL